MGGGPRGAGAWRAACCYRPARAGVTARIVLPLLASSSPGAGRLHGDSSRRAVGSGLKCLAPHCVSILSLLAAVGPGAVRLIVMRISGWETYCILRRGAATAAPGAQALGPKGRDGWAGDNGDNLTAWRGVARLFGGPPLEWEHNKQPRGQRDTLRGPRTTLRPGHPATPRHATPSIRSLSLTHRFCTRVAKF